MPGDVSTYQIDFITVKQSLKTQVQDIRTRTYPGCDIGSDHVLVMMKSELKFKKIEKGNRLKWN